MARNILPSITCQSETRGFRDNPKPPPAQRKADKYPLNCGRVLTGEQCIREKEEKAEEKKKQEENKNGMKEHKIRREQKAEQKEAAKKKGNA